MTKAIEDELNLPRLSDALKALGHAPLDSEIEMPDIQEDDGSENDISEEAQNYATALTDLSNIKKALSNVNNDDFTANEKKFEDLQELAVQAHKDLMDAGFNVAPQQAGNYLNPAITALAAAMDIEKTRVDRKLKLLRLKQEQEKIELQRRKLEMEERKMLGNTNETTAEVIGTNETFMADRNQLLDMLKKQKEGK